MLAPPALLVSVVNPLRVPITNPLSSVGNVRIEVLLLLR